MPFHIYGQDSATNESKPLVCNTNGQLEADITASVSGLATETTLSDIDTKLSDLEVKPLAEVGIGSGLTGFNNLRITDEGSIIQTPRCINQALIDGASNTQELPRSCSGGFVVAPVFPYAYNGTTWDRVRNGQETMDKSLSVAIASNQSDLNVSDTRTSSVYRNIDVNATGDVIKASGGQLVSIYALNWSGLPNFIKLYDKATAPTNADIPVMNISLYNYMNGSVSFPIPVNFVNGIGIRATSTIADSGNTNPTSNAVSVTIAYI